MTTATLLRVTTLLMLAAAPAYAGPKIMASAPASNGYPTPQDLRCNILNLNKTAKPVTIDVLDYSGNIVSTSGPLVLAPSTAASHLATDPFSSAVCRFTVEGSTKKYRAVATYNNGASYTTAHAAP